MSPHERLKEFLDGTRWDIRGTGWDIDGTFGDTIGQSWDATGRGRDVEGTQRHISGRVGDFACLSCKTVLYGMLRRVRMLGDAREHSSRASSAHGRGSLACGDRP